MNRINFTLAAATMLTFCSYLARPQTGEPPKVIEAWNRYEAGCSSDEERPFDQAACQKAFEYIKQVMRSQPSSIRLGVAYGGTELALKLPGAEADAQRRFRAAIRAEPAWPEPYYLLASLPKVPEKEQDDFLRQLLKANPKADQAYDELIGRLAVQDARSNAGEIVELFRQYHEIVPYEKSNFETDQFAMLRIEEAGRYREAFAILRPIIQYAESSEDPGSVCAQLSQTHPGDFGKAPEFQAEVARFKSYCTELDHAMAAGRLLDQRKFPEAAHELELQIATNPKYLDAFRRLANLYLQLDQKNDAVRILHQFLDGDWTQKTKCATLKRFGELANYRVPGDQTVDLVQAACDALR